jgi:hypothetical protein
MKKLILISMVFIINGCVLSQRPNELRNDVTPTEYSSSKNAKVLALCIQDEWEKIDNSLMKVEMREKSNGYSVWVNQSIGSSMSYVSMKDSATFIADIDNTKTGSAVHYYTVFTYKEDWISALKRCLVGGSITNNVVTPENLSIESSVPVTNKTISQKMNELNELKKSGLITEDEFQNKKKSLLEKL